MKNKVLLLINTGTPSKPERKFVARYLSEFLIDIRVIDLPWLMRKILVNFIIVPFRATKSTAKYRKLWTPDGSPLLYYLNQLVSKIRQLVRNEYKVFGAMRYGEPSLKETLKNIKILMPEQIIVFPLFPQYASSTTGSVNEFVLNEIRHWNIIPEIKLIGQFYSHPQFIEALVDQVRKYEPLQYDHILFSYHGLPLKHIQKIHPEVEIRVCDCHKKLPEHGTFCYRAACFEMSRLLISKLNLNPQNCSVSFQSRFSSDWLTPFSDVTIKNLAESGTKRLLVFAPSFVADCLETLNEIGLEYNTLFKNSGGDKLTLVESLNDNDKWVEAVVRIADL